MRSTSVFEDFGGDWLNRTVPARPLTVPCQTFAQLKRAVEETFMAGQRRAEELKVPPFHTHERKLRRR